MESFSHPPNPFPLEHRNAERRVITTCEALDLLQRQDDIAGFGLLTLAQISYRFRVLERKRLVEAVGLPALKRGLLFEATSKGVDVTAAIRLSD